MTLQHPLQSQPKVLLISLQVCNLDTSEQLTVPILVHVLRHGSGGSRGGGRGGGGGERPSWQQPSQLQPFSLSKAQVARKKSWEQVACRHGRLHGFWLLAFRPPGGARAL